MKITDISHKTELDLAETMLADLERACDAYDELRRRIYERVDLLDVDDADVSDDPSSPFVGLVRLLEAAHRHRRQRIALALADEQFAPLDVAK
jgi:hypothetical protein